jgi:ABC-type dipeptide/oligopeptide/nickel transport system ATPase component
MPCVPGNWLLDLTLSVDYPRRPGVLTGAELSIGYGEIVGLVGQSGSGKTTLGMAIPRLVSASAARVSGRLLFRGEDLLSYTQRRMRSIRGKDIGVVFQGAQSALNPALRLGTQLREVWRAHRSRWEWKARGQEHAKELLRAMGLPADDAFLRRYPAEISIGQAQRVLIAMAVMHSPALVIADEPTSALDIVTQAEVLKLLRELRDNLGTSVLFISHDLGAVASLCDRIAILFNGAIVETIRAERLFSEPQHPYTRSLIEAIPVPYARSLATQ